MIRLFGAGVAVLLVPLAALDRSMRRTGGPGIIAFKFAGTPERSRKIMDTWDSDGQSAARLSLLVDYPFLVSYSGRNLAVSETASDALRRRGASGLADAGLAIGVT